MHKTAGCCSRRRRRFGAVRCPSSATPPLVGLLLAIRLIYGPLKVPTAGGEPPCRRVATSNRTRRHVRPSTLASSIVAWSFRWLHFRRHHFPLSSADQSAGARAIISRDETVIISPPPPRHGWRRCAELEYCIMTPPADALHSATHARNPVTPYWCSRDLKWHDRHCELTSHLNYIYHVASASFVTSPEMRKLVPLRFQSVVNIRHFIA